MDAIAVRNESVRLSLQDDFTSGMARAAAATALFKRELNDLDGTRVGRELSEVAVSTDRVANSARRSGPDIDKFSGRFRLMADAALTLGPALIPLAASTLPALSAAFAGFGATAGGIGALVLAFNGMGDAVKSIQDYDLEPTAENLQKMRVELEKAGPAGAEFARYVDDLRPALDGLKNTAREGLFPGLEDGIDSLLTRLPLVEKVVNRLSLEMGDLARDGGAALAGEKFRPFLDYVRREGAPILDDFARATGNVTLGLANLLVAFDPLTQNFTGGLLEMSRAFAEWSAGLEDNRSFQEFLDYVRESGPKALDLLGSLAGALAGIAKAAAPWGDVLLPALTALADVLATIADSPIGAPLFTAVAAMTALGRVTDFATKRLDALRSSADRAGGSFGRIGLTAGGIAAVGVAVGLIADNIGRIDPANLERSLTALGMGNVTADIDKIVHDIEFLASPDNAVDLGEVVTVGGLFGDSTMDKFADNIDQVDQSLARLVESGNADQAALLFQQISDLAEAKGVSPEDTAKQFDAYTLALENVGDAAGTTSSLLSLFGQNARGAGDDARDAAAGAQAFSDALAGLNGWLDKREALRGYRDGVKELGKGFKDGFGREDVENIDAIGRSITQVASTIKDRGIRANFLAGARESLEELANKSGPKAKREVEELIGALDRYGLTKPPTPKLDADDKPAKAKVDSVRSYMRDLVGHPYKAKIDADGGGALNVIANVQRALDNMRDGYVTVHVNRIGGVTSTAGGHSADVPGGADGMTVPGKRFPYGDKMLVWTAPGEEIISNRHGQADRFRADRAAGRIPGYADGGSPGQSFSQPGSHGGRADDAIQIFVAGAWSAAKALKAMEKELGKTEKALDREKSKLEQLTSQRDSLASSATGALLHDPFGNGLAGFQAQNAADQADSSAMLAALQQLVKNGLDPKGALFQALAASGDVTTAQQMAALTSSQLFAEQASFNQTHALAGATGQFAASGLDPAINDLRGTVKDLQGTVKNLNHAINQMGDKIEKGSERGTEKGSHKGITDANEGRNRRASGLARTGGGG